MFISVLNTDAQDARFSQFYTAPLHHNPALAGVFDGKLRATVNYRNQWSSILSSAAFNTIGASFDMRFKTNPYDYVTGGLAVLRDDAGNASFNQTTAHLTGAYLKKLAGGKYSLSNHYAAVGFQAGVGQHGVDWSRLNFSAQFDNGNEVFVPTNPTGENNTGNKSDLYADVNAGIAWYSTFDEDLSVYAGVALHHIMQPNVSFYGGQSESLYRKWVFQAGGEIPFTTKLSVLPAVIFMKQGPATETMLGANVRYSNNDYNELALRLGGWVRTVGDVESALKMESLVVTSMLELEQFLFGVSYDVNVSSLREASNTRGAFELSLTYILEEETRYKVICPKF